MRRVVLGLVLTVLDLIVFAAGSFARPFGIATQLQASGAAVRLFLWDGLLLMTGLYLLTLGVEAARKRLGLLWPVTTVAFVLAALLGYWMRFGFVTREL